MLLLEKSKEMKVNVEQLNIQPEHIHLLIDLPSNICMSDYVQGIKGSSSHWINEKSPLKRATGIGGGSLKHHAEAWCFPDKSLHCYYQNITTIYCGDIISAIKKTSHIEIPIFSN